MNVDKLIKQLSEHFGDRIKVNSPYHVQVLSSKGKHDIWMTKGGYVRFKVAGKRAIHEGAQAQFIIRKIKETGNTVTDVERMKDIVSVTKTLDSFKPYIEKIGNAVFTDSGFKAGKARIAAIVVVDDEITIKSRMVTVATSYEGEKAAITLGLSLVESEYSTNLCVYNDNKAACELFRKQGQNVKWLSRKSNAADRVGNMRGEGKNGRVQKGVVTGTNSPATHVL